MKENRPPLLGGDFWSRLIQCITDCIRRFPAFVNPVLARVYIVTPRGFELHLKGNADVYKSFICSSLHSYSLIQF